MLWFYREYKIKDKTIELRFLFNSKKAFNAFAKHVRFGMDYYKVKIESEIPIVLEDMEMLSDIRYYLKKKYPFNQIAIYNPKSGEFVVISWEKPIKLSGVEVTRIYSGER